MQVFGTKQAQTSYLVRKGAYVIIFKNDDKKEIGLIRAHGNQYFLPGGGIRANESKINTLKREMLEETGYLLKNVQYLCRAQNNFMATLPVKQPMTSDGFFYTGQLAKKVQTPTEKDNHFEWVKVEKCEKLLFHIHQLYAVQQVLTITNALK